jgi:hypothetical protein
MTSLPTSLRRSTRVDGMAGRRKGKRFDTPGHFQSNRLLMARGAMRVNELIPA